MSVFPRIAVAPPDPASWDEPHAQRRLQGELVHQALALLEPGETDAAAVSRRLRQARVLLNLHAGRVDASPLCDVLVKTLNHPAVAPFFAAHVLALTEQEIVVPDRVPEEPPKLLRIDRLAVFPDGSLWVLDFKLGAGDRARDRDQIRSYQRLAADVFQRPCHGALIYLDSDGPVVSMPPASAPEEASMTPAPFPSSTSQGRGAFRVPAPIRIFPLRTDILEHLRQDLLRHYNPPSPLELARRLVIFPHRRPRLHLHRMLAATIRRPFMPPRCLSLEDWMLRQGCLALDSPPDVASLLDQAWLLYALRPGFALEQAQGDGRLGWHRFMPWGLRLAGVIEEMDSENIAGRDIVLPPEDMPEPARTMLAELGGLQRDFHAALAGKNLTTFPLLAQAVDPARILEGDTVHVCGLFAMTATEAALVGALWRGGARLWWQADRPLPDQLERWAKAWRAPLEWEDAAPHDDPNRSLSTGRTTFVQAHDLHSQLRRLAEDAASWDQRRTVAVILPDPSQLRPLLSHLPPSRRVNVTLGLPLERTSLGALLGSLARMAMNVQISQTGPRTSECLDFFLSPWVCRLLPEAMPGRLRRSLADSAGGTINRVEFARVAGALVDGFGAKDTFLSLLTDLLFDALELSSLSGLCVFLKRLLSALRAFEMSPEPLEMHVVHVLYNRIIPDLENALCRCQIMSAGSVWSVFLAALRAERVPFSGEPLTPWQIMGLLESRLLCFDKVVVLDCLEGTLPAASPPNPLLPEILRPALGLPPGYSEEGIIRHHLQRLMASAREVVLYSRRGLAADPLEGRTVPSRYWEQAIWREEKAGGISDSRIEHVKLELSLGLATPKLPDKDSLLPLLRAHLTAGLSLSALNTYLSCPLRFLYEYLARFQPRPDLQGDSGARLMGETAHKALEVLFQPHLNQWVVPKELVPRLEEIWDEEIQSGISGAPLSPASRFFHVRLLKELLQNYLSRSHDPVFPIMVEEPLQRSLPGRARDILMRGRLDRVDQDPSGSLAVILDYKTGPAPLKQPLHLGRLQELTGALEAAPMDQSSLIQVKEQLVDLQLPGYLYLLGRPALCGFWQLGEWEQKKACVPLVKPTGRREPDNLGDYLRWQEQGLPRLMEWIGVHLIEAPFFYPACLSRDCLHCPWGCSCPWAAVG